MSTPEPNSGWRGVLNRHAVALISLTVALFATSYNTWRNEITEAHCNTRQAAFSMLQTVGEFQEIVDHRFWGKDRSDVNRIRAWGRATLLRDMSPLVSKETNLRAQRVFELWASTLSKLDEGKRDAERELALASGKLREQLLADLVELQ